MTELELLIATRRDLHRHPEIGFEERRTAGIVAERLEGAGYEVATGVAVTGVVGTLRGGGGAGPTLLMRADMDALPIDEASESPYASTIPNRMHACGHDGHVAIGLAVAERLARRRHELPGEIRYVFQPAEEGMGGAKRMVDEGVLEGVDAAIGLHLWLELPNGVVGLVDGPQMAGSQEFRVTVNGRGGHGGMPDGAVDAVLIASQIVVMVQSVVSRNVSPLESAVISVGSIRAGSAPNVIAETAYMEGTIRAYSTETQALLRDRIRVIAEGVATTLGGSAEVEFAELLFPPTQNDPDLAGLVRSAAASVVGQDSVRSDAGIRTMAAEDFAEFATRVPGCYFFLGARDETVGAVHPHHSPYFDLSEEALPLGVDILEEAAVRYLTSGPR
jgi:amidohydrolase